MKRPPYRIIAITLFFLLYSNTSFLFSAGILEDPELNRAQSGNIRADRGVLDLRNYDFSDSGLISLRGEWEFHENHFLQPGSQRTPDRYISSGASWENGEGFPPRNFGSYRLTIFLPEGTPGESLHLEHREVGSAARIYWNGEELLSIGRPASTAEFARGAWNSGVSSALETADRVEVIIHMSNYDTVNGGLIDNLIIGPRSRVFAHYHSTLAMNYFLLGILSIMAVYHLFLFFYRRREPAPLWFAVLSLFLGLRALVVDTFPLTLLIPHIGIAPVMRLNFLTFSVSIMAVTLFVHFTYPGKFSRILAWTAAAGSLVYSALVIFAPTFTFTSYLFPFQLFSLLIALGLSAVVLHALFTRKPFSGTFALGFLVLLFTAVFDIIKTILLLPIPSLSSLGMVLFILILSLNLSRRTTRALQNSETLSARLQQINDAMERFVPREFLKFLKKNEITDIHLGDHSEEFLTVLFADLKGFTKIAEESGPEHVFDLINTFLAGMGPAIRKNKGFVDKYLGDGIMALFSGNSSNAIQAAIEMHQALDHLNANRKDRGLPALEMGIGIHTGSCMLGTIGEDIRMDGTVISDAVNLSFRLQSLTRTFAIRILISGEAVDHAMGNEGFYLRNIGSFAVKGRENSVDVVEVINADPPEIWKQKRKTRKMFEKAVFLHRQGKQIEALELFRGCRTEAPHDGAVRYYLENLS